MLTKIIEVRGERTELRQNPFGPIDLYPDGTNRIVWQYNIFPKELNEERKGWFSESYILQRTAINFIFSATGDEPPAYYNEWKDVKFVEIPDSERYRS